MCALACGYSWHMTMCIGPQMPCFAGAVIRQKQTETGTEMRKWSHTASFISWPGHTCLAEHRLIKDYDGVLINPKFKPIIYYRVLFPNMVCARPFSFSKEEGRVSLACLTAFKLYSSDNNVKGYIKEQVLQWGRG